jgi:hypothetical protein
MALQLLKRNNRGLDSPPIKQLLSNGLSLYAEAKGVMGIYSHTWRSSRP